MISVEALLVVTVTDILGMSTKLVLVVVIAVAALAIDLAPTAEVVWVVPSGNFTPPEVDSIVPATVKVDAGDELPIPTLLPFTAMGLFPSPVDEVH